MNKRVPTAAFTLIEMMISIGLGMLIVTVAMSGVRMAGQSVSTANRLSLENSMLRAGYFAAMQDADWWLAWDDPDVPSDQRLRDFEPGAPWNRGLPFTEFTNQQFPGSGSTPTNTDRDRGWDSTNAWQANDSRTWFSGNLVEEGKNSYHVFGHYELFSHVKISPSLTRQMTKPPFPKKNEKFVTVGVAFGGNNIAPRNTWYNNQLESLKNALGYYGVVEYMPANAIYGTPGDPGGDNTFGNGDDSDQRMSQEWCDPSGNGGGVQWRFANNDGGTAWARGIYRHTRDSTFPIIPASRYNQAATSNWSRQQLVEAHCRSWATDRVFNAVDANSNIGIVDLTKKALIDRPLLESRPESWPDMQVQSMRYLSNSRFVAMFRIGWTNTLTGEATSISLTTISTSLRGARQQRKPQSAGGGWAKPNDLTLDKPQ